MIEKIDRGQPALEAVMRKFVQALILIVGFGAAIAAVGTGQKTRSLGNCYEIAAPTAPITCN